MKLKIAKQPDGSIRLELKLEGQKKPQGVTFNNEQIDAVIGMLQAAQRAKVMSFEYEVTDD